MPPIESICYFCLALIQEEPPKHGLHPQCFQKWFNATDRDDFTSLTRKEEDHILNFEDRMTSSFFHGQFKKYSARLRGQTYILKVAESHTPELPATEYLCNQIARALKIPVPDFYFISFYNETPTFLSKNFMEEHRASNLVHIYRFVPQQHDAYNCETLLNVVWSQTNSRTDVENFISICLFDALIGNHDRHGRNLALIDSSKKVSLAPFYDNPSYIGLESFLDADLNPLGRVSTSETQDPSMKDYIREFRKLGFEESIIKFQKKLLSIDLDALIVRSFISEKRKNAVRRLIEKRQQELHNECT